jgi:ParB family chromosome partitioning protein
MTRISLAQLHDDPANARRVIDDDLDGLVASMRAMGQLQSILVRPAEGADDAWQVVAGSRRVRAARTLGWDSIEALPMADAVPARAASTAENMQRKPMHPVDQWRALAQLCADGDYSVETAAMAIGIELAQAKRLKWLGQIEPALLDAMGQQPSIPETRCLRLIAMAPHDVQLAGFTRATTTKRGTDWDEVARMCVVTRIPATRAIFDVATSGLPFDEDMFAEPGSAEQYTTTDVAGFIGAQEAALDAEARKSRGRITVLTADPAKSLRDCLPKGWTPTWETVPKRFGGKTDPRRVFAAVTRDGYRIGLIDRVVGVPAPERGKAADMDAPETIGFPGPAISKVVQGRLAAIKAQAVRDRLGVFHANGAADMLRALLLTCALRNVGFPPTAHGDTELVPSALIDAAGLPRTDVDEATLCALAAGLIGNAVAFDSPNLDWHHSSGPAAEWLAALIGAEMPRTDSAEVLKGITGERLAAIAEASGISARGTVGALRKRLEGALPDWRAATFGAPGPHLEGGPFMDDDDVDPDAIDPVDADESEVEREDAA